MPTRKTAPEEPFPFDDDDFNIPDEVPYEDMDAAMDAAIHRDDTPALPAHTPQPAPPAASERHPLPAWRQYHPAQSHTIEWADAETPSIRHTHTVYADTLDEVLVGVRQVKAVVQAAQAKARASKPAAQQGGGAEAQGDGWCSVHSVQMTLRTNEKGSWYSHRTAEGAWCSGYER